MLDDNSQDNSQEEEKTEDAGDEGAAEEITIDQVDDFDADNLTDDQKTFLEDNKSDLTDEQAEKFGIKKEPDFVDETKVEPETRGQAPKKEEPTGDEAEDEEDVEPADKKAIKKIVEESVAPIRQENQKLKDEAEVNSFLGTNPEFTKYKGVILKYVGHEAYKNIPVANIATMVASKDLMALGAAKEREASKKAADTRGGGSSARKAGGGKFDWSKATPAEVAAKRQEIMQRPGA